jgi:hypothetical protein
MEEEGKKACSKCRVSKPLSEFYEAAQYRGGRHSWCKRCLQEANTFRYRKRYIRKRVPVEILDLENYITMQERKCGSCQRHLGFDLDNMFAWNDNQKTRTMCIICKTCHEIMEAIKNDNDGKGVLIKCAEAIDYYAPALTAKAIGNLKPMTTKKEAPNGQTPM